MLREILTNVIFDLLLFLVAFRFRTIWALKNHIKTNGGKHIILNKLYNRYFEKKSSFVGVGCEMADIPIFPHGICGIFISQIAVIGRQCTIFHQVTIGSNTLSDSRGKGAPVLGDGVFVGAGAKIIGGVTIGDGCRIGAGAVVVNNMAPFSVAVAQKVRIIQKDVLNNKYTHIGDFVRQQAED